MRGNKSKIIYGSVLAVMILVTLSLPLWFPLYQSKTLRISYTRPAHSEFFGPVSEFCASNTCDRGLSIVFYSPQAKIHGTWSRPEEQFLDINGYIGPHQCVYFVVPPVTNQMPWRVIAEWHYENGPQAKSLWDRIENVMPLSWQNFFTNQKSTLFKNTTGPVYDSYSQQMINN